jgi:hypothetical protein
MRADMNDDSVSKAVKEILAIIERDMEDKNLSEEEKNLRAGRFAALVDGLGYSE